MSPALDVPTRRRLPRDERSRQLLDAAEDVFAARGIAATTMEDIGERAGVTKPVLYDHFGSKDGLMAALIARRGAELRGDVEAALEGSDGPDDALARGINAYFEFIERHRDAWSALTRETATTTAAAEALEEIRSDQASFITELIVADYPDAGHTRASTYAQIVIGACERLATYTAAGTPASAQELTVHVMDVIWTGFAALRAGGGNRSA
ncbi:MAG: TetR/AcrR family transcriptional regulator [Actinomycetota bacterium]